MSHHSWRLLPVLIPSLAFAAPEAIPANKAETPKPAAQTTPPTAPQARRVTVDFHGPLREAIKKIAAQGGLSVIVTGELEQPSDVMLTDASAEDALTTVARLYQLEIERQGTIWTVRPMTASEKEAAQEALEKTLSTHEESKESDEAEDANEPDDSPEVVNVPPLPPIPPLPPMLTHGRGNERDRANTGDVTVNSDETVHDAVAFGGRLEINGHVEGNAVAFGGPVHLGEKAVVDGNVTAFGGEVTREKGAVVRGTLTTLGNSNVGRAVVTSLVKHEQDEADEDAQASHSSIPGFLLRFALFFGLGFLLMIFAPNQVKQLGGELRAQPARSFLAGLVGFFALIGLTIALCVTLIGIPVAAALVVLALVGIAMGFTSLANEVGQRFPLARLKKTQAVVLALGTFLVALALAIPYLGWILLWALSTAALGAAVRTRLGTRIPQGLPQSTASWNNLEAQQGAK